MLKLLCLVLVLLLVGCGGCGGSTKETEYLPIDPGPSPVRPPKPRLGGTTYAQIKPLLQESCGGASCHAGASFLKSEQALRSNSQVRNRIASDSMPPRYAGNYFLWEDGTRKRDVLTFLSTN